MTQLVGATVLADKWKRLQVNMNEVLPTWSASSGRNKLHNPVIIRLVSVVLREGRGGERQIVQKAITSYWIILFVKCLIVLDDSAQMKKMFDYQLSFTLGEL